jgi:hypothetical protein
MDCDQAGANQKIGVESIILQEIGYACDVLNYHQGMDQVVNEELLIGWSFYEVFVFAVYGSVVHNLLFAESFA